jgi:hypothetical protein
MPNIITRACRALRRFLEARAGMPELVPPAQPAASAQPPQPPLDAFGEFDLSAGDTVPTPLLVPQDQQHAPPLEPKATNPGSRAAVVRQSSRPPRGRRP